MHEPHVVGFHTMGRSHLDPFLSQHTLSRVVVFLALNHYGLAAQQDGRKSAE